MKWVITDAEDERLQGLSADAQVIYLRVLRRQMNFTTGVSEATYGEMKRALEYLPDAGSSQRARRVLDVSTDYIRARLAELERAGLVARVTAKSRFEAPRFRCLLAHTGQIRPEKEPQENPKCGTPMATTNGASSETPATPTDTAHGTQSGTQSGTPREPQVGNPKRTGDPDPVDTGSRSRPPVQSARAKSSVIPSEAGRVAVELRKHNVAVTSHHPMLLDWVAQGVTVEFALECLALARQRKPGQQRIPAAYLGAIIEDQRTGGQNGTPDWARIPRDDNKLEGFAVQHGYSRPPVGMRSYGEYRALLRNQIEKRAVEQEKRQG